MSNVFARRFYRQREAEKALASDDEPVASDSEVSSPSISEASTPTRRRDVQVLPHRCLTLDSYYSESSRTQLRIATPGAGEWYCVKLHREPTAPVRVNISVRDSLLVEPTTCHFTVANWRRPQHVHVRARPAFDELRTMTKVAKIWHYVVSTDPNYHTAVLKPLSVYIFKATGPSVWSFGNGSNGQLGLRNEHARMNEFHQLQLPRRLSDTYVELQQRVLRNALSDDDDISPRRHQKHSFDDPEEDEEEILSPTRYLRHSRRERLLTAMLEHRLRQLQPTTTNAIARNIDLDPDGSGAGHVSSDSDVPQDGAPLRRYVALKLSHRHDEKLAGRQGDHDKILSIAAGTRFSVLVCYDGNVYSCGQNDKGQLGVGDQQDRREPTLTTFEEPEAEKGPLFQSIKKKLFSERVVVVAVACGAEHSAAISTNGSCYTWGENCYGQLGLGDTRNRTEPSRVRGLKASATLVAAGMFHTVCAAVTSERTPTVYAWGHKLNGALGVPISSRHQIYEPDPIEVLSRRGHETLHLACGSFHSALIDAQGDVYTCGLSDNGQLGRSCDDLSISSSDHPLAAAESETDHDVDDRESPSSKPMNDDLLLLRSFDVEEPVRRRSSAAQRTKASRILFGKVWLPKRMQHLEGERLKAVMVSCGGMHTIVLASSREVFAFGDNATGQLGVGDTRNRKFPTRVDVLAGKPIAGVAAGLHFSAAWTEAGYTYVWGEATCGQLGTKTERVLPNHTMPMPFLLPVLSYGRVRQLVFGGSHTLALTEIDVRGIRKLVTCARKFYADAPLHFRLARFLKNDTLDQPKDDSDEDLDSVVRYENAPKSKRASHKFERKLWARRCKIFKIIDLADKEAIENRRVQLKLLNAVRTASLVKVLKVDVQSPKKCPVASSFGRSHLTSRPRSNKKEYSSYAVETQQRERRPSCASVIVQLPRSEEANKRAQLVARRSLRLASQIDPTDDIVVRVQQQIHWSSCRKTGRRKKKESHSWKNRHDLHEGTYTGYHALRLSCGRLMQFLGVHGLAAIRLACTSLRSGYDLGLLHHLDVAMWCRKHVKMIFRFAKKKRRKSRSLSEMAAIWKAKACRRESQDQLEIQKVIQFPATAFAEPVVSQKEEEIHVCPHDSSSDDSDDEPPPPVVLVKKKRRRTTKIHHTPRRPSSAPPKRHSSSHRVVVVKKPSPDALLTAAYGGETPEPKKKKKKAVVKRRLAKKKKKTTVLDVMYPDCCPSMTITGSVNRPDIDGVIRQMKALLTQRPPVVLARDNDLGNFLAPGNAIQTTMAGVLAPGALPPVDDDDFLDEWPRSHSRRTTDWVFDD